MTDDDSSEAGSWQRLGHLLMSRRVQLGFPRRAAFARHLGLTHDRTLADLELARRKNFDATTLLFVEQGYGWTAGSIAAVLAGGEPTVTEPNPRRAAESKGPDVGPGGDDAEDILFRLPPGLSPREREAAKRIATASIREYIATLQEEDD